MTRGRHAKRQYSKIIILFIFILTMIIGMMWHLSPTEKTDQTPHYKTLQGQIVQTGDQVVLLRQKNNQTYLLSLAQSQIEGDELLAGNHIKVSYTGHLDSKYQDIQDVKVYSVVVSAHQIRNGGKDNTEKTIPIEYLSSLFEDMSNEDKIDQLLIGYDCNQETLANHQLGGLILSSNQLQNLTKNAFASKIDDYQNDAKLTMLIGIDDDNILKKYVQDGIFEDINQVYNEKGLEGLKTQLENQISIYKEVGINLIMKPYGNQDEKSLQQSRNIINDYVSESLKMIHKNSLASCYQSYPSYEEKSLDDLNNNEFQSLRTAIEKGQNMICTTDQTITALDSKNPIALSKTSLQYLRETFHYNGIIVSDLTQNLKNTDDYIIKAIQSGNDMIICDDIDQARQTIIDHINNNEISMNQIDLSVLRVLAYKYQLGLIS